MRAIVTGASGFVGKHLIQELLNNKDEVLALHSKKIYNHKSLTEKNNNLSNELVKYIPVDITDLGDIIDILARFKPDIIYHLAAISFVPEAEENFKSALDVNVLGTHAIFKACNLLEKGIKVVLVSSGEVYGRINSSNLPISENCACNPANNYSLSKLMAEQVAHRFTQYNKVASVIMRSFNHIGSGQNERFVTSSFAKQLAKIALKKIEPILYVGNLSTKRDFSDVRDIVKAYRLGSVKGEGIYNLGSGHSVSILEILNQLIEISSIQVKVVEDPTKQRPSEIPDIYCTYNKAEKELGWKPLFTIKESLEEVYKYWYDMEVRT